MALLGVVLATYNEADNLPRLIEALEGLDLPFDLRIFVVDDSSPDGTSRIADELASEYGNVSLITRPGKLGLGSAFRDGMREAIEAGCTHIVTMDADLSHDPRDVPTLLAAVEDAQADLAQGSRYVPGGGTVGWPWRRRLQSRIANLSYQWLLGCPRESTTSFRVHTRRSAQLVVHESRARDFEFQPECVLLAMSHGLRIVEVPIIFAGRSAGESKLDLSHNVKWLLFLLWALFAFRLRIGRFSRTGPPCP